MRESRPYGSERGAFSNGRPYRDRTDGHRGAGRSRAIPLFAGQHQTFVARRGAGVGLKNAVAGLEVSTPRDGFVRRSRSRIESSNVVVRFVIEQQEINK
jgi:hypothetical protein